MPKPLPNSIAALADQIGEWRRDFHAHPELSYAEHRTAARVAELLRGFGLDTVAEGLGGTGVVGVLHGAGGPGGPAIMLRADMDALPIAEATGVPHASRTPGVMHACGHDGHTAMLLGAARHLAETRNFRGTVCFCFQPAEEDGAGAHAMIRDGLFERFPVRAVYGMHNWPGLPIGHMAVTEGPVSARADSFTITLTGKGGHGAVPQDARDPLLAGAWLVAQLQTVVSRRIDPRAPAVLSICAFQAGEAANVIPDVARLRGTTRCYSEALAAEIHAEIARIAAGVAAAHGVRAEIAIDEAIDPPTVNDPAEARFAHEVMRAVVGEERATFGHPPAMVGEDFAYLAREVPGAYVLLGNGDTQPLHHPEYEFSDAGAAYGTAFWVRLAERALPAG
ncbi:M20 aminoacylase family protein [Paralimibaculum aggregatum]|uniref:M20 aminoacylase family protein n=1 Tax=Paralimibaculum aggregatum TaxID=3036245 RepID=A0ABQ6LFH8_9RHOB|nr:amidohydrolase [Limibaculum sp. NKW23]GMG82084.1 M20 aminoacylase family protein [Limibaculum sp. NKW23]